MVLTGPISWPISKLLDVILGEELGVFYKREQLKQLLMLTQGQHGINKNEVNMITGVLSINEKNVKEIMTDINDVYMLDIDTKITFEVMQDIVTRGFSRIPVYENDENNIVGLLFVKDLAFVDPDDELPLQSVIKFYSHPAHTVLGDMKVLQLMQDFMSERYHMAIVAEIEESSDNSKDDLLNKTRRSIPYFARKMSTKSLSLIGMSKSVPENEVLDNRYIPIGVVTLEDIIEEIIQQEIVDETDAYVTNDFKKKNEKKQHTAYPFAKDKSSAVLKISPQLQLATFTFLSTQIPEFDEEQISANVLNKLLRQDVIKEAKPGGKPIVEAGKPIDSMIMILSGELKIEIGMEKMQFIQGPFSCFCIPALVGPYVPDVTVLPSDVVCLYLCIYRDDYKRAIEATKIIMEQDDKPHHRPITGRPSTDDGRSSVDEHRPSVPSIDEEMPSVAHAESDRLLEAEEDDKLMV
jgi:metal transporter CNNM